MKQSLETNKSIEPIDAKLHSYPFGDRARCKTLCAQIHKDTTPPQLEELIKSLEDDNFAIDCPDEEGWTLLLAAIRANNFPLVQWLVEHQGANVNYGNDFTAPLAAACFTRNLAMVQFLLAHGASVHYFLRRTNSIIESEGAIEILQIPIERRIGNDPHANKRKTVIAYHKPLVLQALKVDMAGDRQRTIKRESFNYARYYHDPLHAIAVSLSVFNPLQNLQIHLCPEHKFNWVHQTNNQSRNTANSKIAIGLLLDAGCSKHRYRNTDCVREVVEQRFKTKLLILCSIYKDQDSPFARFRMFPKQSDPIKNLVNSATYAQYDTDSRAQEVGYNHTMA